MKLQSPIKGYTTKQLLTKYPAGVLMQGFDEESTRFIYKRSFGINGHNGADWSTGYGHSILAALDGKVVEAIDQNTGYGMHVRIVSNTLDGSWETTYGHLSKVSVKVGDLVKQGDKIGEEGNSGTTMSGATIFWGGADPTRAGVHLHFGLRELGPLQDGYQIVYSTGDAYTVKNHDNGFFGSIDPLNFMSEEIVEEPTMLKLIKHSPEAKRVYAVIGDTRFWIFDPSTLGLGKGSLWKGWEEIEVEDVMKYRFGGGFIIPLTDDPEL